MMTTIATVAAGARLYSGADGSQPDLDWQYLLGLLPRVGISRLADVSGLDQLGVAVCLAVRPNSRGISTSQGKGFSGQQAKISALMESLESWHAERIRQPVFAGSMRQAKDEGLLVLPLAHFPHRPTRLPLVQSPTQLIEMTRLSTGQQAWAPLDCVSTDFTFDWQQPPIFMRSSNGLAAGCSLEQAGLHALTEVVERHHVQHWWLQHGLFQPAVQLTASAEPKLQALLQRCAQLQLKVLLWDLSAAAVWSCVAVLLIAQPDGQSAASGLFTGYGCQPDLALAIQSAVLEAVQSRLTLITGSRDDLDYPQYQLCRQSEFQAQLWNHHRHAVAYVGPAPANDNQQANWLALVRRVEQFYQQPVYGLDLTDSELQIPVIRLLVPGLQNLGMTKRYYLQQQEPLL
jgi:ribosomal protein S12 methylthiotransferase accessory factor